MRGLAAHKVRFSLTVLSVVYSLVDEAFHWHRYVRKHSDRVEMWSHVGIFVGHGTMMLGWWAWYFQGYGGVAETVAWISRFLTLQPGDLIATGTPSGVGSTTGTFLKAGDVVEVEITGLGTLRNPVAE